MKVYAWRGQVRSNSGEIIGESRDGKCWIVRFDNRRTRQTIVKGFIRQAPPSSSAAE